MANFYNSSGQWAPYYFSAIFSEPVFEQPQATAHCWSFEGMQNVGDKQKAKLSKAMELILLRGEYPSASRVARAIGRKPQKYKGDGLNPAENKFRREWMQQHMIPIRLSR